MKASEILRKLADVVAAAEGGEHTGQEQTQHVPQNVNVVELTPAHADNTDNTDKTTMVPPLQQKMEILKKSVGVNNEFDQGFDQEQSSELNDVKKLAGLSATQQEAADDEPLEQ